MRMSFQRGFYLSYMANQKFRSASIMWMHAQAPGRGMATGCWGGCCDLCPVIPGFGDFSKEWCDKYATDENRAWYGTCKDWNSKKCHI